MRFSINWTETYECSNRVNAEARDCSNTNERKYLFFFYLIELIPGVRSTGIVVMYNAQTQDEGAQTLTQSLHLVVLVRSNLTSKERNDAARGL